MTPKAFKASTVLSCQWSIFQQNILHWICPGKWSPQIFLLGEKYRNNTMQLPVMAATHSITTKRTAT
jgi:hypothetical protein